MEHGNPLVPSPTLLAIQLALFVFCYAILKKLVFAPFLKLYHEREHCTHGASDEAAHLITESQKLKTQYEEKAKVERARVQALIATEKNIILENKKTEVQKVRSDIAAKIEKSRQELQNKVSAVRSEAMLEVSEVSLKLVEKLLGKNASLLNENNSKAKS